MSKPSKPSVATYADHEVITPAHKLRGAVRQAKPGEPEDDPIARAEEALAQLSTQFAAWMESECVRLDAARNTVKQDGFSKETHASLFRAAHDIKGEGATFGYPGVTGAADSLCRLLEHTPDMARIPLPLVDQHVDAMRAIIREHSRPDAEEIAAVLTKRLRDVTDEFLVRENRHRPDYLEGINAPSIAPDEPTF
jgi:chemotaxis protein histidine kinase CheA